MMVKVTMLVLVFEQCLLCIGLFLVRPGSTGTIGDPAPGRSPGPPENVSGNVDECDGFEGGQVMHGDFVELSVGHRLFKTNVLVAGIEYQVVLKRIKQGPVMSFTIQSTSDDVPFGKFINTIEGLECRPHVFKSQLDGSQLTVNWTAEDVGEFKKTNMTFEVNYEISDDPSIYRQIYTLPMSQDFGAFDFIIVGGGSTGSVIANRLSQEKQWKILLLEAGVFGNAATDIPDMMSSVGRSDYNWGFESVPQKTACLDLVEDRCQYPRGQGFGGTSLINGLMYVRGNKRDFDRWASEGNQGWSYDKVLPYFKKNEHFRRPDPDIPVDWEYHGFRGELSVELTKPRHPLIDYWINANAEKGYNIVDYNGREQLGASVIQANTDHGRRADFGTKFLKPIKDRPNLTLLSRAYVTKISIDNGNATGVEFTYRGQAYSVRNSKEVILSAGVFGSAQILMLSGVGPKEHLQSMGIETIVDLEVGTNLQDHPTFYGLDFNSSMEKTHLPLKKYIEEYLHGVGPLTSPHFNGGIGFYLPESQSDTSPSVELVMFPNDYFSDTLSQKLALAKEKTWEHLDLSGSFTIMVVALHARSKGTVRLKNANPFEYPLIDSNLLSDQSNYDIDRLYEGVQLALDLLKTKTYAQINATLIKQNIPACDNEEYLSKEYWYCVLRQFTWNLYHPIGTCRMGPDSERGDVVDAQHRVYGVGNLRVADASIFPFALSGHPNAVCGMIGEKFSDLIKSEYQKL